MVSTINVRGNNIVSTDTKPPTVVEGTCDLIYARRVSTGLDITNIHVITPTAGPVIIMRIGLNITNIHVVTPTF